ncbi:Pyridoxamine 5'-phosphate oxidase [Nostocoides japonicum T1-X7]|uniref:Pyridoxamine 5'-phosphate oxidase n=1 Tax=Nostocoides japonicum T1-X7 TaxID=1194083 RepID=A0A077LU13_9MICO|nr:TIGR03668 family PPOX class F420-dependent oxidoreductase [Tetrasphaera japonica]CCH76931.1 Pyridoxamine 5'-phosphate oxidase [Tetrasphaera japonica T1-X7]
MDPSARDRFAAARVARLATVSEDGRPHLVPVVFAVDAGEVLWTAVDGKPKTTRALWRLRNITANPRVSLLVDSYAEDWSTLWWVRADGLATIAPVTGEEGAAAVAVLARKYPQYLTDPPPGPLIRVEIDRWVSWSAATPHTDA